MFHRSVIQHHAFSVCKRWSVNVKSLLKPCVMDTTTFGVMMPITKTITHDHHHQQLQQPHMPHFLPPTWFPKPLSIKRWYSSSSIKQPLPVNYHSKKMELLSIRAVDEKKFMGGKICGGMFAMVSCIGIMASLPEVVVKAGLIFGLIYWFYQYEFVQDMCDLSQDVHERLLHIPFNVHEMDYLVELAKISVVENQLGYHNKAAKHWKTISTSVLADSDIIAHANQQFKKCLDKKPIRYLFDD
jgi:hypothetical protein